MYQPDDEHSNENLAQAASMAPIKDGTDEPSIDDSGTAQTEASAILKKMRDELFDGSHEKLALALGRPTEEIGEWTAGAGTIDGDVLQKARTLASERGLTLE